MMFHGLPDNGLGASKTRSFDKQLKSLAPKKIITMVGFGLPNNLDHP